MKCPRCRIKVKLLDSRGTECSQRRRYECPSCSDRWTTFEVAADELKRLQDLDKAVATIARLMNRG